jgi:uncharacterized membrane protein YesL
MAIGTALRQSLRDFYFNSWRLAPANLAWGIGLVLALVAGPTTLLGAAMLLLLAVPAAGLYRMGAQIARDEPVDFSDFVAGMRGFGLSGLLIAGAAGVLVIVFTTNVVVGLEMRNPLGWIISAFALWGDVGLVMFLTVLWPVLVDPQRAAVGLRRKLALAGLAVIGRPVRVLALTLVVVVILAVSAVLFAAILLVSVAYVALVSGRVVLPLVDEVEARLPEARQAR